MAATFYLAVLATILGLGSCETFCCLPQQWEGSEGFQIGYSAGRDQGLEGGLVGISYDGVRRKVAAKSNVYVNGKYTQSTVLQDYNKEKMYIVNDRSDQCLIAPIRNADLPTMCLTSENSKPRGSYVLGFEDDAIQVQLFEARDKRMPEVYSSVSVLMTGGSTTRKGDVVPECTPVGETVSGSIRYPFASSSPKNATSSKVNFMGTIGYMNVTRTFRDMSVFNIPDLCRTSVTYIKSAPEFSLGSRSLLHL